MLHQYETKYADRLGNLEGRGAGWHLADAPVGKRDLDRGNGLGHCKLFPGRRRRPDAKGSEADPRQARPVLLVGAGGFEPPTSTVSR